MAVNGRAASSKTSSETEPLGSAAIHPVDLTVYDRCVEIGPIQVTSAVSVAAGSCRKGEPVKSVKSGVDCEENVGQELHDRRSEGFSHVIGCVCFKRPRSS